MLTQIIAGDSLLRLGQRLHECRAEWGIPQHCACSLVATSQPNEILRNLIKGDSVPVLNGNVKQEIKEEKKINESNGASESKTNGEDKNSPLHSARQPPISSLVAAMRRCMAYLWLASN